MRKRGSNAVRQPGRNEGVPVELELAALDDLGPRARSAVCNAPLGVLAFSIVSQIVDMNDKIEAENNERASKGLPLRQYLDPKHPDLDARLANGVISNQVELLRTERSNIDATAGVRPLRARPSAKSVREQRRSDRASRRVRW